MSHKICYPMTEVPEYMIGTITVKNQALYAGDVVAVNLADSNIPGNFTQYEMNVPTTDLLKSDVLAIVISGGNYNKANDGRKPKGQPDYTQYKYDIGETAPVLFLYEGVVFYVSDDSLANAASMGDYLYGVNNSYMMAANAAKPNANATVCEVIAKHSFRLGGMFGGEFANGNVCRVIKGYAGGSEYVLPTASANTLGGVKVGEGLDIDETGKLSATGGDSRFIVTATSETLEDAESWTIDKTYAEIITAYNNGLSPVVIASRSNMDMVLNLVRIPTDMTDGNDILFSNIILDPDGSTGFNFNIATDNTGTLIQVEL